MKDIWVREIFLPALIQMSIICNKAAKFFVNWADRVNKS